MFIDYKLTKHATERLQERTSIKPDGFNEVMMTAVDLPFILSRGRRVKMFWSDVDDRAYLAYIQPKEDVVITIYEAYNFIDGQFVGKACAYKDESGNYDISKAYHVLRSDVNYLLVSSGRGSRDVFAQQAIEQSQKARKIDYEIMASFNYFDSPLLVRRLKRIPVGDELSLPYEGILQDLAVLMLKNQMKTDGLIDVLVYAREPSRSSKPAGPTICSIEIEQLAIKSAIRDIMESMEEDVMLENETAYGYLNVQKSESASNVESMEEFLAFKRFHEAKAKEYSAYVVD